jgi:hypothetical protein
MESTTHHTSFHPSFHPAMLDETLPTLSAQRLCISILVPFDVDGSRPRERTLQMRTSLQDAATQLERRAGLYPYFTAKERIAMKRQLTKVLQDPLTLEGFEDKRSLAIYVTPEQSVVIGLDERHDGVVMVADHPYTLSLHESAQHFHERFFYLMDVSADAMRCWRVEFDGSSTLMIERSMEEDIDYRPAAGYADNRDEPLQGHGGAGARDSIYHGHSAHDSNHFDERQKRLWRDTFDEVSSMLPSSHAPMVLRGERSQRDAFLNAVEVNEDDFILQTNLQHEGTTTEQMLSLVEQLGTEDAHHRSLMDRWDSARSHGLTETHTMQVARQVAQGLVDTLIIARTEPMWGEFSQETGDLLIHDNARMSSGEVRDLIAKRALELGAEVHLVDAAQMPTRAPFVAILRGTVA